MIIKVEVTAKDIANGKRMQFLTCPVARAIRRATGKKWWVRTKSTHCNDGNSVMLSAKVCKWISRFDGGHAVNPFSFTIRFRNAS